MKIHGIKKITDCKFVNLFSIQYTDMKNRCKEWIFASRSNLENPLKKTDALPDAVVVVPFHARKNRLVVIKELRLTLGGYQYGFPAGLVDDGESVEQAGIRELFEETGLNTTKVIQESPAVFSTSGLTDESVSMLFVECEGTPTSEHTEDSEDIEVLLFSQDEASKILYDPHIKFDVKTWIVLNMFATRGCI